MLRGEGVVFYSSCVTCALDGTSDFQMSAPRWRATSLVYPRPRRVKDFPTQAFLAFSVALAASAWALFADIGKPYLPSIPILIYTLYLYANRTAVGQQENDALKDSPYFLGFLLTMFGLFKIFNDVSFNFALFGRNPELMTEQVGGAVLTTIVGLFSRQALLGLVRDESPAEDDRMTSLANAVTSHAVAFEVARQQFFREMAEERSKQTRDLETTQERFLARLDELTRSVPIIGGPQVHAEAGYALGERPGAIVVGATPRPTVGFTSTVPASADESRETGRADSVTSVRTVDAAATPFTAVPISHPVAAVADAFGPPIVMRSVAPMTTAEAIAAVAASLPPAIEPSVPRTFEPMAALVTPPPSSGKGPTDWIVAASRPDTPDVASMPTPTYQPAVRPSADDARTDRSRATSAMAAPYVRPARGTPGFGDAP